MFRDEFSEVEAGRVQIAGGGGAREEIGYNGKVACAGKGVGEEKVCRGIEAKDVREMEDCGVWVDVGREVEGWACDVKCYWRGKGGG